MLKKKYAKKEDIPAGLEGAYVEKGGAWVLQDVESEGGGGGGGDDPPKLREFRDQNIALRQQLETTQGELRALSEKFKGVDVEGYRKVQEQISKMQAEEEKALLREGKIDDVVQRRTAAALAAGADQVKALQDAHTKLKEENSAVRAKLGSHLIEQAVQVEISRANLQVRGGALEDVLARTTRHWKLDDKGNPVASDLEGKPWYDENAQPLKMGGFVRKLVETAPHLFVAANGGGAQGGNNTDTSSDGKIIVKRGDPVAFGRNIENIAKGKAVVTD